MPTIQIDMDDVNSVTFDSNTVNAVYLNSTKIWEVAQPSTLIAYATAQPGVTYTAVTDLSSYTDAQIEEISKAISNCQDITSSTQTVYLSDETSISVGATRSYTLSTQEAMTDRILGFNHDTLTSSTAYGEATATGKAGMTWQMVNCLDTKYKINTTSSNYRGWNWCNMRTTILPTIKSTMPQSFQNIIKIVDKKAANGGSSYFTEIVTSQDDLFFLAEIEVFGTISTAEHGLEEGSQYTYWALHNTSADRIKYFDNSGNPTTSSWWERSCTSYNTNEYMLVNRVGDASKYSAGYEIGVSFAYCT